MKILYYKKGGSYIPGIYTSNGIIDVNYFANEIFDKKFTDTPFCNNDIESLKIIAEKGLQLPELMIMENDIIIGPCVPNPSKIICIGLNYRRHANESGMAIPTLPIVFSKFNNTLADYNSDVALGDAGEEFDYEVELGVIIGAKTKNISKKEALKNVFGYCVANDMSCRDLQFLTSQWLLGKSLDNFLPLGKYIVTADEIPDPQNLQLTCTVNEEQRQNSNTSDMIFSVAEIISFLSEHMTLEPGDIILTGTPEGVILGMKEKNWLKSGDTVTVEIEKLGSCINRMG